MKRVLAYGAALTLALAVGPLVPGTPTPTAAAAPGDVLVAQTARLGANPTPTTDPGRQIASAWFDVEVIGARRGQPTYFVNAGLTLRGTPDINAEDSRLVFGVGHRNGSTCMVEDALTARTDPGATRYTVGGYSTEKPDQGNHLVKPSKPWSCVVAVVEAREGAVLDSTQYDAVIAPLKNTYHRPKLGVGKVAFLGKNVKQLRLVRGTRNVVEVTVRNTGKVSAGRVRLTGKGKGVKVGAVRSSSQLVDGRSLTFRVPIRINAARARKVRLTVQGGGVKASKVIVVRPTKAPPRPLAGSYRSPDGQIRFTVRNGRIVGWHGTMMTRCGIAPAPFTYTQNTYDFPARTIPRNGIVLASKSGKANGVAYGTTLRLRIAGGMVTRGLFTYNGPGGCSAIEGFTARRVGP